MLFFVGNAYVCNITATDQADAWNLINTSRDNSPIQSIAVSWRSQSDSTVFASAEARTTGQRSIHLHGEVSASIVVAVGSNRGEVTIISLGGRHPKYEVSVLLSWEAHKVSIGTLRWVPSRQGGSLLYCAVDFLLLVISLMISWSHPLYLWLQSEAKSVSSLLVVAIRNMKCRCCCPGKPTKWVSAHCAGCLRDGEVR